MNTVAAVRRATITGLAIAVVTALLTPAPAFASPVGQNQTVAFSQAMDLPAADYTVTGALNGSVSLTTHLAFSQSDSVSVGWDDSTVRQGGAVNPQVTRQPGAGTLTVEHTVGFSGTVDVSGSSVPIAFAPTVMNASTPCSLGADGDTATCVAESGDVTVVPPPCPDIPGSVPDANTCPLNPQVAAKLRTTATFSVSAVTATRSLNGQTGSLDLGTGQPVTDQVSVPCTTPVGDPVTYALSGLGLQGTVHTVTELVWTVEVSAPALIPVVVPYPPFSLPGAPNITVYDATDTLATDDSGFAETAPDVAYALGSAMANNVPPTVTAAASYTGDEGSAIPFSAAASGPCAAGATFVWSFSDGGTAYGNPTTHVFTDSGPFSGMVTATDVTGLSGTTTFGVGVNNLPPAVIVTPADPTVAWGRPLTLQAQATDPGAAEQSTLTYAWDFHDGSAIVTGGPSETHQWADPGTALVTVTVCDRHGGCTGKDVSVTVRARTTSTSYTGDLTATYSAPVTYRAAVIDEFGRAVNGAPVAFTTGGGATLLATATTGGTGSAAATVTEALPGGSYPITAAYAGDARYVASSSTAVMQTVTSMASSIAYTGTLTSKPNARVPLSATVTDVLGRPIANQTVTFVIGSQTVTAPTGADGVAATTLKLMLKPGTYPVTVSWTGIAGRYAAATWTGSFKLNTK
jgi:hypothetical protein